MTVELDRALALIEEGDPLPVDLTSTLIEQGIDVEHLVAIHSS